MAQLTAFRWLSSASYFVGKWQQQRPQLRSPSTSIRWKASALPIRLCATVIRRFEEELSPKELHHLRKKEAQKKIRKIRKERRAKRRAEELARTAPPKPNPALLRFERPLWNWNKPRKQKTKKRVASVKQEVGELDQGLAFDVRNRRSSNLDASTSGREAKSESSQSSMTAWSEFEAVYEEKMRKPPGRIAHEQILLNFPDQTKEFENNANYSRGKVDATKEWHRGGGERTDSDLPSKLEFDNRVDSRRTFSQAFLRKIRSESGAAGSDGGADDRVVVRGFSSGEEDELNASASSNENDVEDFSQEFTRSRGDGISFVSSEWRGEAVTSAQKLDSGQKEVDKPTWRRHVELGDRNQKAESEVLGEKGIAGSVESENSEETQLSFRTAIGLERVGGRSNSSAPSGVTQQPVLERRGGGNPSSAGQDIEISEFWDRRDMHLHERFDQESLKTKFESSAESRKFARKQRMAESEDFQREVGRIVIGRRKGEDVYLSTGDDDATVVTVLPRSDLNEVKQLDWLAKQLDRFGRADGVHLSRLMRSGGLKITAGRAVSLVQRLGELGNWRRAMQVVEWLNGRNHFPPVRSRYLFTTLLAVLGKARRPVESLNVFNVMREHVATYPDMPAYHAIAVTLGQSGYMEELFELMQSLRRGPVRNTKYLLMLADQGCLIPDIVVYNAALNSCVPHKHWRCALWILDELYKEKNLWPNSASYGLAIEVMVKARKYDLAWKTLERMELGGFHPNSSTYKVLVEGLGQVGKADLAVEMVKQMEERGIVAVPGVYYALASTLCISGRWKEALLQVDRLVKLSKRSIVETYTGLIKACKEAGHWRDAISVFDHMQEVCAPDIGTYNIMISIYGANKMYDEAKKLFDQIKTGRISPPEMYRRVPRLSPDSFTFDAMLGSSTVSEKWEDIEVLFRQMLLQGFQLNWKRHAWIVRAISEAKRDDLVIAMFNHLRSLNAATSELYILMINACLRGGEQEKAFSYLGEMVQQDMRISSSDLQKFEEVAFLLSEDDRLNFMNKVEELTVTSDFNFKVRGLSSLHRQSLVTKPPKRSGSLSSILHKHQKQTNISQHRKNLQNCQSLPLQGILESKANHVLSLVGVSSLVKNEWPPRCLEDLEKLQNRQGDQISGIPGWELLWRNSSHFRRTSSKFGL